MNILNEIVPKDKLEQWDEILTSNGGVYLRPPKQDLKNENWYRVDYKIDNLTKMMKEWDAIFVSPEIKKNNKLKLFKK